MFDDTPKEPEDILAGADPLAANKPPQAPGVAPPPPAASTPAAPAAPPAPPAPGQPPAGLTPQIPAATAAPKSKKMVVIAIIIVIMVVVVAVVLVGTWLARKNVTSQPAQDLTIPVTEDVLPPETTLPPPAAPPPSEPLDTDSDGLTDEEEKVLGTAISIADTDGDLLSDYDEVRIWNTNPLNPDTDNDGFTDGAEIEAGYDPNDAGGKLLDLNQVGENTEATEPTL